jgi:PIN domain nuclease of toxin-antitoxin system
MKFLLDTHTFLFALRAPGEIADQARGILADPGSELLISIVIPWEIAIKSGVGKLKNISDLLDDFEGRVSAGGFRILETSIRQVIRSGKLPLHHKDPFDRLLISQALDLDVPIISCDHIFDRYAVKRIWH